ncbi:MAG TPA: hypothetical protein VH164_17635 [Ktedonobacteraceae bacterium]|nr:hypothetical protein [Ktedonobacteraceae bacterium]
MLSTLHLSHPFLPLSLACVAGPHLLVPAARDTPCLQHDENWSQLDHLTRPFPAKNV